MGLKLFFALAVAVGCALIGRACAGARLRRAALLAGIREELALLRVRMLEGKMPLPQALRRSSCPVFAKVGLAVSEEGVKAAWQRLRRMETRHGSELDALLPMDLQALDALFSGLGASGSAGQTVLIDNALRALERQEKEATAQSAGLERLYTTLGLLAGLVLALVAL